MEIFFIIALSFFISLIWINYFKSIDIFENEKFLPIVITFVLGSIIPFSIYLIHDYVYFPLGIVKGDNLIGSFVYYLLAVGLLEELIKFLPLLIILYFIKGSINEPIDYIKYIGISALGFAFGENIEYALNYGNHVLIFRSILSVPGHLFFSAIFIYGYIEYAYLKKSITRIFLFAFCGILAHGIYDFLLDIEVFIIGKLIHLLFFMLIISVFINILNNCLNLSPFYSPKKVIDQYKVRKEISIYYFIAIVSGFFITGVFEGADSVFAIIFHLALFKLSLLTLIIVRLSRFDIIPEHINAIKLEFPFKIANQTDRNDIGFFYGLFVIKGESYNSAKIAALLNEEIKIIPLSKNKSILNNIYYGVIVGKVVRNKEVIYVLKLFVDKSKIDFRVFYLKAKTNGVTHNPDGHPIASLNSIDVSKKVIYHEWVILKNIPTVTNITTSPTSL